jgi:hypothetical protein
MFRQRLTSASHTQKDAGGVSANGQTTTEVLYRGQVLIDGLHADSCITIGQVAMMVRVCAHAASEFAVRK